MSKYRVLRGGSFINDSWSLRSALRRRDEPEFRFSNYGFRIVIRRRKL